MHVIFVEPYFPFNQREFPRALKEAGAVVTGIGEAPKSAIDGSLGQHLDQYVQVGSVCNEQEMLDVVRAIQKQGWVDRLEATVEAHILPVAKVREACGIPGTSVRTAFLCRDKPAMKEALRQAGVPCAQSTGAASPEEVRAFVEQVGYPVILKPRDGAGAAGATRVDDPARLEAAISESMVDRGVSVAVEEYIEGHEGFFDTLSIEGKVAHEFVTHYYPNVLDAMRNRWISPQFIATNRSTEPGYDEVKVMGRKVIEALGIGTSATHMEWFYGPKGLKFSEIGCRPPGVGAWDLYCAGNDLDLYREWANCIVRGRIEQPRSERFSAGLIALRPSDDGRIQGYTGLEEIRDKYGQWIIDFNLPEPGHPTRPVEGGYMANAYIRMRHPDYDELRRILSEIGEKVKVVAG